MQCLTPFRHKMVNLYPQITYSTLMSYGGHPGIYRIPFWHHYWSCDWRGIPVLAWGLGWLQWSNSSTFKDDRPHSALCKYYSIVPLGFGVLLAWIHDLATCRGWQNVVFSCHLQTPKESNMAATTAVLFMVLTNLPQVSKLWALWPFQTMLHEGSYIL